MAALTGFVDDEISWEQLREKIEGGRLNELGRSRAVLAEVFINIYLLFLFKLIILVYFISLNYYLKLYYLYFIITFYYFISIF